jgi:hypothetical protein
MPRSKKPSWLLLQPKLLAWRTIAARLKAYDGLRDKGDGDVEIDNGDTEYEDREGEKGGEAGEDSEWDGDDEEKGHEEGVDGVQGGHGW